MKLNFLLAIIILLQIQAYGQYIGALEIEDSSIRPWIPKLEVEYAGVYLFGESESESEVRLFFSGQETIGQIKTGYWEEGTGLWKWNFINLTNIRIDKAGNFKSDQSSGQFVVYNSDNREYKGLKIDNPWTGWIEKGKYEVGIRKGVKLIDFYSGKFPDASILELDKKSLEKFSAQELSIMRNEIYARYGYIFKTGGDIDKYFKQQSWYRPEHKDVNRFLTTLERRNIKLIQEVESGRKEPLFEWTIIISYSIQLSRIFGEDRIKPAVLTDNEIKNVFEMLIVNIDSIKNELGLSKSLNLLDYKLQLIGGTNLYNEKIVFVNCVGKNLPKWIISNWKTKLIELKCVNDDLFSLKYNVPNRMYYHLYKSDCQ
ncbi:MAG: YARHG domain-containing protein [Cytophagaceae bacterium]